MYTNISLPILGGGTSPPNLLMPHSCPCLQPTDSVQNKVLHFGKRPLWTDSQADRLNLDLDPEVRFRNLKVRASLVEYTEQQNHYYSFSSQNLSYVRI